MHGKIHNHARSRAEVITLLRGHGITPTQQRVEIGQILFGHLQHVSAEKVLEMVNEGRNTVSKATVYNTLGLFARKGLIRQVIVDPTKLFYDTNLTPHHHIYHTDTGTLEDVHADNVKIDKLPNLPQGTHVEGVDVIIRVRNH
jgi:Fur family iron response transcriptional regulator